MLCLGKRNLSNSQHRYRVRLSTETALAVITGEIYHKMDNSKMPLLTLCDFSEAFDSINHIILINRGLKLKVDSFWFNSLSKE